MRSIFEAVLDLLVSSAGIHDPRLASPVCEQISDAWPSVWKGLVDRGYRGELMENIKRDFNIDIEVCSTHNGTNGFTPKLLRWVEERAFKNVTGKSVSSYIISHAILAAKRELVYTNLPVQEIAYR